MSDRRCAIEGCDRQYRARGWCATHYRRWQVNGDPNITRTPNRVDGDLPTRFWAKVEKTETCWLWTGALDLGYGKIGVANNRTDWAHRVSFELNGGVIPAGMKIDHRCRNRACVRPGHLRVVTDKQNQENSSGQALPNNKTSGVRGVFWSSQKKKWQAKVEHYGRVYDVGRFSDLADAAEAVRLKRIELFTHNDADRRAA